MRAPDDGELGGPADPQSGDLHLAGVAHDVNQMLAVITGRAGLLRRDEPDPVRRRHLQAIILAAEDATAILRRVGFGRGAAEAAGAGRPLRGVAEEAGLLAWPGDAGWTWRNRVPADVAADTPAQVVREVLVNLLLNAREVLGDGGVVTVTGEDAGDGRVRIVVADNGPGLPPGDPERVFGLGITTSGQDGRGVGLAACRLLLERYGGGLQAADDPSGGARFTLDLPAAKSVPAAGETAVRSAAAGADPAPDGPCDVLVVDDEPVVRDMLHDVLEAAGCRVRTCRDAAEALAFSAESAPQVAFVDRNLPGVTGPELARRLRVGDPCLAIVGMTGWQDAAAPAGSATAEADFDIRKPLSMEQIHTIVAEARRLWQSRRAARPDT